MIEQAKAKVSQATAGFTMGQRVVMAVAFVAIVGGLWTFSQWASESEMAPLYADLEIADAAAISEELDTAGVTYELADGGRTILVPRDKVYEVRLDLSSAGLPDGGTQGYSLLDDQGITSTQFQQRIAFQRALEGELSATIRSIDAIEAASVHLVIPREDLFVGDDIESTASVLVKTTSTLAPTQVQAIVNLVAGSVEGLRVDAVTVADQTGLVLAAPGQDAFSRAGLQGESPTQAYELDLSTRLEDMLAAVVGPGNAMVTVSATVDWDRSSIVSETHTPSVVAEGADPLRVREGTRQETYSGNGSGEAGVLGDTEDASPDSSTTYSLNEIDTEFVNDTEVTTTESAGGNVEQLNVAVLINETSSQASHVAEIESLVTSAAGIDVSRGDTVVVSRLEFDTTIADAIATELDETTAGAAAESAGGGMIGTIVLAAVALIIVVIAAIQLWRGRLGSEEVEELDLAALTSSLTAGMNRPTGLSSRDGEADYAAAGATAGAGGGDDRVPADISPSDQLHQLVERQPDEVARLLRTWLADKRAVAR